MRWKQRSLLKKKQIKINEQKGDSQNEWSLRRKKDRERNNVDVKKRSWYIHNYRQTLMELADESLFSWTWTWIPLCLSVLKFKLFDMAILCLINPLRIPFQIFLEISFTFLAPANDEAFLRRKFPRNLKNLQTLLVESIELEVKATDQV